MTHYFDGQLKSLGMRSTQGSLLVALNARESWLMSDLAEVLGMERTTLVRNLQPLQRDGWVVADSGHGGRGGPVSLSITDKGRKQMEIFVPAWETAQQAAVNVLGEERWTAIMNDLRTVALTLDN